MSWELPLLMRLKTLQYGRHVQGITRSPVNTSSDPVQQGHDNDLSQSSPLGLGTAAGDGDKREATLADGQLPNDFCRPVVKHLEQAFAPANNGKDVQMQPQAERPSQHSTPLRPEALNEAQNTRNASQHAPEEIPGLKQQQPEAFEMQVAAALQSSSQVIANLTARLEAVVLHTSGASVQGYEGCTVALRV